MSIPTGDRRLPVNLSAQGQKKKTIKAMVDNLFALSDQQPVLYIFEDAHWIDPSTLEVLELVADRAPSRHILVLITYRPEFVPPWSNEPHITVHPLSRLSPRNCAIMLDSVTGGKALPDEIVEQIVAKTDGVPLFVEELTKAVIESGLLEDEGDRYEMSGPLPTLAIPTTLQDSLMARLDRLASVKEVAQIGACIGREFSYELLSAVSPLGDDKLRDALQVLVDNGLVFRRGNPPEATFTFKHALIEEAAYQSLLKSKRHQFHQQIAEALKTGFPDTVATKPESLAHHYTEAGLDESAITYWLEAGRLASARSANIEAIAHLSKGIELVQRQPDNANRDRTELDLQVAIGTPLIAVKSWTAQETGDAYSRARDLCQALGNPPELLPVLYGLWAHRWTRADLDGARDLAEEFLREAEQQEVRAARLVAHRALGTILFGYGQFNLALQHLQQTVDLYDQRTDAEIAHVYGMDPKMGAADYIAWTRWLLGFPDGALQTSEEALAAVRQTSHSYSTAFALAWHALILLLRGDYDGAQEQVELCLPMSLEQRFPFVSSCSRIFLGWALANRGDIHEGVTEIESGLAEYRAIGGEAFKPTWICVMANISGRLGRPEEGINALDKAFALVGETKERWWEAELHRSRGQLLLLAQDAKAAEAEQSFRKAIQVAQSQQAKSLELRAATSLSRLWQSEGKRQEAHDLLAPVYDWFTEGFDTADLKDAKALLSELK
jgi:predicted ATPase